MDTANRIIEVEPVKELEKPTLLEKDKGLSLTVEQVVCLYEEHEMPIEDLSIEFGVSPESIKAALLQGSSKYREQLKASKEMVSDAEDKLFVEAYKNLALTTDNVFVKERALRNLINEKRGRNGVGQELVKADKKTTLIQFNQMILNVQERAK